jgi:hypothetical protein
MMARGRAATSRNVHVTPEFRDKPDIEKLAKALLAVAKKLAEKEQAGGKGDAVA